MGGFTRPCVGRCHDPVDASRNAVDIDYEVRDVRIAETQVRHPHVGEVLGQLFCHGVMAHMEVTRFLDERRKPLSAPASRHIEEIGPYAGANTDRVARCAELPKEVLARFRDRQEVGA